MPITQIKTISSSGIIRKDFFGIITSKFDIHLDQWNTHTRYLSNLCANSIQEYVDAK